MKRSIIRFELVPYPYMLSLWDLHSKMIADVNARQKNSIYEIAECDGRCIFDNGAQEVWVGVFNGQLRTLVHEIDHAVTRVFQGIGMERDHHTSEASAYLVERMFVTCRNALDDHARREKLKRRAIHRV